MLVSSSLSISVTSDKSVKNWTSGDSSACVSSRCSSNSLATERNSRMLSIRASASMVRACSNEAIYPDLFITSSIRSVNVTNSCIFVKSAMSCAKSAKPFPAFPEIPFNGLPAASKREKLCISAKRASFSILLSPIPRFGALTTRLKLKSSVGFTKSRK